MAAPPPEAGETRSGVPKFQQFCRHAKLRFRVPYPSGEGGTLTADPAEGDHQVHPIRQNHPRLPRPAQAARNPRDEQDQTIGAGKSGLQRPLAADANPEAGTSTAEREVPHAVVPPSKACPVSHGRIRGEPAPVGSLVLDCASRLWILRNRPENRAKRLLPDQFSRIREPKARLRRESTCCGCGLKAICHFVGIAVIRNQYIMNVDTEGAKA